MRKIFLMTVMGGALLAANSAISYMVERSDYGSIPSHVRMHTRESLHLVQRTMIDARAGIQAVLAAAEKQGFGGSTGGYTIDLLQQLNEGSFVGLHNTDTLAVNSETGAITFKFDPREINSGASVGKFTLTYTPVVVGSYDSAHPDEGGPQIEGWTCTSTASTQTKLGRTYLQHADGETDPLTEGLGWPFDGCEIAGSAFIPSS